MTASSLTGHLSTFVMSEPDWPASSLPPMSADTELESCDAESIRLMLLVKGGDVKAFEKLVELHQGIMIGTAAKMLGNLDDAHDVAQQVFIRVWKSAPRYEPTAKFTTWLFTIMRNLVFNETRRRSRRKEVALENDHEDEPQRQYADLTAAAPDELTQRVELETALDRAIAALPEKQRLAVIMRRYEDMPYEQICETLKMSLPAVKSLLFRARTELRKHLASYLGEDVP